MFVNIGNNTHTKHDCKSDSTVIHSNIGDNFLSYSMNQIYVVNQEYV
jgi:hypothetical protein